MDPIQTFVAQQVKKFPKEIASDQTYYLNKSIRSQFTKDGETQRRLDALSTLEKLELMALLEDDYARSLVEPGKLVGNVAAQSIGESKTQESLDAHRFAGLSSGREKQSGLVRTREVFEDTTSKPSMTLYPKEMLTLLELKRLMNQIKYTMISDVMVGARFIRSGPETQEAPYRAYVMLHGTPKEHEWFIRLQLDPQRLFDRRITIANVASLISSRVKETMVIAGSQKTGTIDIYYTGNKNIAGFETVPSNDVVRQILRDRVLPVIRSLVLGGAKGIDTIFPDSVPLGSFITGITKTKNGSLIRIDKKKARIQGIQTHWLHNWAQQQLNLGPSSVRISKGMGKIFITSALSQKEVSQFLTAEDIAIGALGKEDEDGRFVLDTDKLALYKLTTDEIVSVVGEEVLQKPPYDAWRLGTKKGNQELPATYEWLRSQEYWFMETSGIAMKEMLYIDALNHDCMTCNSSAKMLEMYDIEVNRAWKFNAAIASGMGSVHPTHVQLVIDTASRSGQSLPMNKIGLAKMDVELLAHGNFEMNMVTNMELALSGAGDNNTSMAAAVVTGRMTQSGSGFSDVVGLLAPRPTNTGRRSTTNPVLSQRGSGK